MNILDIIAELEAKAKAATPGPWKSWPWAVSKKVTREWIAEGVKFGDQPIPQGQLDNDFIAAANPTVILGLIREIRILQSDLKEVREDYEQAGDELKKAVETLKFYSTKEHMPGMCESPSGQYWSEKTEDGSIARACLEELFSASPPKPDSLAAGKENK